MKQTHFLEKFFDSPLFRLKLRTVFYVLRATTSQNRQFVPCQTTDLPMFCPPVLSIFWTDFSPPFWRSVSQSFWYPRRVFPERVEPECRKFSTKNKLFEIQHQKYNYWIIRRYIIFILFFSICKMTNFVLGFPLKGSKCLKPRQKLFWIF